MAGWSVNCLKLTGKETFEIDVSKKWSPRQNATVHVKDGAIDQFLVEVRLDTEVEIVYYKQGECSIICSGNS